MVEVEPPTFHDGNAEIMKYGHRRRCGPQARNLAQGRAALDVPSAQERPSRRVRFWGGRDRGRLSGCHSSGSAGRKCRCSV